MESPVREEKLKSYHSAADAIAVVRAPGIYVSRDSKQALSSLIRLHLILPLGSWVLPIRFDKQFIAPLVMPKFIMYLNSCCMCRSSGHGYFRGGAYGLEGLGGG